MKSLCFLIGIIIARVLSLLEENSIVTSPDEGKHLYYVNADKVKQLIPDEETWKALNVGDQFIILDSSIFHAIPSGIPLKSVKRHVDDLRMFNSVAVYGDQNVQFKKLKGKIDSNSTANITIAFFGGSITQGLTPSGVVAFPTWLVGYLSQRYPKAKERIQILQLGRGGVHPFYGSCLLTTLSEQQLASDVFILEYALNGGGSNHGWAYEGLLRTILIRNPDAIIICFGSFWWFRAGNPTLVEYNSSQAEDEETIVAQNYNVAYLSARKAFYYDLEMTAKLDWVSPDGMHPNTLGHDFYGSLLARFIIHRLEQAAIPDPIPRGESGRKALCPPVYAANEHLKLTDVCFFSTRLVDIAGDMFNFEYGGDLISGNIKDGFRNGNMKDGFVTAEGGWINFIVHPLVGEKGVRGQLVLHVLRGWDHIGDVRAECVAGSGCECAGGHFRGKSQRHTTETYPFKVPFTWARNTTLAATTKTMTTMSTPFSPCTLRVSVDNGHQRIAALSVASVDD